MYGDYHRLLYEEMNNMAKGSRDSPYGNILPIIQSSGMGKSRTVYEMGASVFSLPLNIHPVLSDKERDMGTHLSTPKYDLRSAHSFRVQCIPCQMRRYEII